MTMETDVKTKIQRKARRNSGKQLAANECGNRTSEPTPLEHALAVMRDETQPAALRASMAKAAMPYLHHRCAGSPTPGEKEVKETPQWTDLELATRIAHILDRAGVELENPGETPHG